MEKAEFKEKLSAGLKELKLEYQDEQLNMLWEYMIFLIQENKKYNLTGIDQPEEIISKHFLDSLTLLPEIDLQKGNRLIDVGTGAGFPGFVLKIMFPEIKLVLLDSLLKRINFLNMLINRLGLDGVETIHGRAEDFGQNKNYRETFNWVVSRAVAPINILSEYTLSFVRPQGIVAFYKGPDYKKELEEGEEAITKLGGKVIKIKEVKVPDLRGERYIIFIEKVTSTPSFYPRKAGIPKKRPL